MPQPPIGSELERYYFKAQQDLVARGRLRTETNPPDAPFTASDLANNFERIALFDEFAVVGGRFVQQQTPSRIRRWEKPVRVQVIFGDSTGPFQRRADLAEVRAYTRTLAGLTGLDMRLAASGEAANYLVLFLNRAEQQGFGDELRKKFPAIQPEIIDAIRNSPRSIFCLAHSFSKSFDPYAFSVSLILIKAEQRGLMRRSCIQEEMAQALGLANDSPAARPSIFNDDEEFSLLTRHDELLLQMLYDPRLKPGMTRRRAMPLVREIAREIYPANVES